MLTCVVWVQVKVSNIKIMYRKLSAK